MIEEIRALLAKCSEDERHQIFEELREAMPRHAFEARMNASAEVILAALDRANEMSLRGSSGFASRTRFCTLPAILSGSPFSIAVRTARCAPLSGLIRPTNSRYSPRSGANG